MFAISNAWCSAEPFIDVIKPKTELRPTVTKNAIKDFPTKKSVLHIYIADLSVNPSYEM